MQDCSTGRLPRHSDGGSTLPPVSTPKGKRGSRRKKGLGTISAPLTPHAGVDGPIYDPRSPTQQQQQQQQQGQQPQQQQPKPGNKAPTAVTPSRLGRRHNTQSDTGQTHPQQQQQPAFQQSYSIGEHSTLQDDGTGDASSPPAHATPKAVKQLQWQSSVVQQQPQEQPSQQQHQQHRHQSQPPPPLQQQLLAGPPPPAAPPVLPQGPFSTGAPGAGPGASTAAAAAPRAETLQHAASLEGPCPDPPPTLWEFFYAEATPHEKYPTADVLWRQTERDRVYNFLLHVPYQLERIMIFGTLLCFYSFLGALTALPLRCLWALCRMLTHLLLPGRRRSGASRPPLLPGAQLYDLLCALLMLGAVVVLSHIKPGVLYYWMKDITSEFLKIQVLFTALEILDKILSNFGVDVLEALSSTCTLYTQSSIGLMQLLSDMLVAFLLITAHGSVLMCQAMVFAVTMNSKRNALLALMIATNFVELKGQVYKRTDTNKLWALACQDIVERFQLLLVLCFVVVEDISNSGTWWPATGTLLECGRIFLWEVVIDITKHAVLGKFNDIRPGIYREYMRDLCSDSLDKHSHNTHKLVGFCPLGPAALSLRMVHTLFTLKCDGRPDWQLRCAVLLVSWMAACATQVVLGYSLKWLAYCYVQHHTIQAGGKVLPRAINVTPSGIKLFAPSGVQPAVSAAAKGGGPSAASAVGGLVSSSGSAAAAVPALLQQPGSAGSPLNPSFSPKGAYARVAGAAAAASGWSPLSGASPAHSPKGGSSSVQSLLVQLPLPLGALHSSGAGGLLGSRAELMSGLQGVGSGPQSFPGTGTSTQPRGLAAACADPAAGAAELPGAVDAGGLSLAQLQQLQHIHAVVMASGGGSFGSSSSGNGMLAATPDIPAVTDPPAAVVGFGVATAGVEGAWGPSSLQSGVSMPSRLGMSSVQQADGHRPGSPFSSSSQQPFEERGAGAPARASFSDARPGWDLNAGASACTSAGAGAPSAADALFASKEAPAAVLGSRPGSMSGSSSTAAGVAGAEAAPVSITGAHRPGHSSSYSEVSAGGLVSRTNQAGSSVSDADSLLLPLQQQQQQQQQEQEWQRPKQRHRPKRE